MFRGLFLLGLLPLCAGQALAEQPATVGVTPFVRIHVTGTKESVPLRKVTLELELQDGQRYAKTINAEAEDFVYFEYPDGGFMSKETGEELYDTPRDEPVNYRVLMDRKVIAKGQFTVGN